MRANQNTRKTSRSPDRTTAGAKTRTVSHKESATESKTTGVLKRLSTCTHDASKIWWQRLEFLACVAVTSGTTLRMQFIVGFRNWGGSWTWVHIKLQGYRGPQSGWLASTKQSTRSEAESQWNWAILPSHQRHPKTTRNGGWCLVRESWACWMSQASTTGTSCCAQNCKIPKLNTSSRFFQGAKYKCGNAVESARIQKTKSPERPIHQNEPELVRLALSQLNECNLTAIFNEKGLWLRVDASLWRISCSWENLGGKGTQCNHIAWYQFWEPVEVLVDVGEVWQHPRRDPLNLRTNFFLTVRGSVWTGSLHMCKQTWRHPDKSKTQSNSLSNTESVWCCLET